MKTYLLNSAVITAFGTFEYEQVTIEQAKSWLNHSTWESTIGYPETAEALQQITNWKIPVNRKQIIMLPGDEALVFRLTKRLELPEMKGRQGVETILANCELGLLRRLK